VEACTVTTPDATTAFAVPNPNCSSQSQSVFSGLAAYRVAPAGGSLGLVRIGNFLFSPTLSTVDGSNLNISVAIVNAHYWCNGRDSHRKFHSRNLLSQLPLLIANEFLP
jgi:hypothetical protein